ncbi:phosphoenolpyruvate synthase [Sulfurospirillum sp. 1612]|uniref:phosphoenolpyruvate synthase n=1 Tax=Sulfurospirillum sp. 1612 TaxID=3094835 RepID=UPI002F95D4C9
MEKRYIKWFEDISLKDIPEVGGKNANLGEMYQHLKPIGVNVPNGFAITSEAYQYIFDFNNLWKPLEKLLHHDLVVDDINSLQKISKKCKKLVNAATIPPDLADEILDNYAKLKTQYGEKLRLAVRSSATAEDSKEASFAGQNETYLNISSKKALLMAYKQCIASNFEARSIHYKHANHFDYLKVFVSVVVMKMVRSDKATSGVIFSIDTETGFEDVVFISAAYGLGENIVQGVIEPDTFYVHKPTLEAGHRCVLKRRRGKKEKKMIFAAKNNNKFSSSKYTKNIDVTQKEQNRFCLSDDEVLLLADYTMKIEHHYSNLLGVNTPMDIEWAKDGLDGIIYIVQARPETVHSNKDKLILETYKLKQTGTIVTTGNAIGTKIGTGSVRLIQNTQDLKKFKSGEILVANTTTPDWEPVMKRAAAIITNHGGRTCHAAIISRELGVPAIVGTKNATEVLNNAQKITVSCAEGEIGNIYDGTLDFEVTRTNLKEVQKQPIKIMMNLANPDLAFSLTSLPVDGVGLARMEFIISTYIKAHPMAIRHPEKLNKKEKAALDQLSTAYQTKEEFFVTTLSEGIATIAASVYPNPCIVRMSDFKSNEYANLIGGRVFEVAEENPMIGFRGAARYSHPSYKEGFELECRAMKRVRDEMGFTNVILMIPFCRRVAEGKQVLDTMAQYGLKRGENNLLIYVMCEIPNNVISIDEFSKIFDGFSIGSNDLTQLTLGVDRESEIVAFDYDERDPGVLEMIKMAVLGAKRNHRYSGICGQAPSDYPEIAKYLLDIGIESISLNPDSVLNVIQTLNTLQQTKKPPLPV